MELLDHGDEISFAGPFEDNCQNLRFTARVSDPDRSKNFRRGYRAKASEPTLKEVFEWMADNGEKCGQKFSGLSEDEIALLSEIEGWLVSDYGAPAVSAHFISVRKVGNGYSWVATIRWMERWYSFSVWKEDLLQGFLLAGAIVFVTVRAALARVGQEA